MPKLAGAMRSVVPAAGTADRDLLARYAGGSEAAFAALVRRHTGLVLGVCRRVLPCVQDAEDATQAVFLVLAKQAGGRWQPSVANWLYSTARKVALKALRANTRRTRREAKADPPASARSTLDTMTGREAFAALDEELDRLPPLYREPLVLCCLQGLTRDEAAERLAVPPATLKSRLDRGRKRLAAALDKRGIASGAALLAVVSTSTAEACPHRLLESILATAGGSPSVTVAALARGVAMNAWAKPMTAGAVLAAMAVGLMGLAPQPSVLADEKPAMKDEKKPEAKKDAKPEKPSVVAGTVVGPDGKPVAGATVYIGHGGHDERAALVKVGTTDADGQFRGDVPKEVPAYFRVIATKPGFGVAWEEPKYPAQTLADADKLALKLTKDQAITGRVVDTEGKPVAGATIGVLDVIEPTNADLDKLLKGAANGGFGTVGQWEKVLWLPKSVASATTDKDGKFELAGLGADRVVGLTVSGKGLARMSGMVVTRTGVDVDPLNRQPKGSMRRAKGQHPVFYPPNPTFVVEPGYAVEGVVTDKQTGKPVAGCLMEVNTGHWDRLHTTSDTDGKYRFDGLTKGMGHYIHVHPPKGVDVFPTWGDVAEGKGYQTATKDFALAAGAVFAGKVIDKQTKEPVRAEFQIIPTADNEFAKRPEYETASRDMVWKGSGNTFRIVTLPGKSRVNVQVNPTGTLHGEPFHQYRSGHTLDIDLKESGNVEFVVEVERGQTAGVKVVDADGKPAAGLVTAGQMVQDHGLPGLEEKTPLKLPAADTEFTVYGLGEKEKRRVVVIQPAKRLVGVVQVKGGENAVVKLEPLQPLRGTFTHTDGTPLAGLVVTIAYDGYGIEKLFRDHLPGWATTATTDKDGKFEIPDVIPGLPFTFDAHKGQQYYRGVPRLGTKTVPAGKPLELGVRKLEEAE